MSNARSISRGGRFRSSSYKSRCASRGRRAGAENRRARSPRGLVQSARETLPTAGCKRGLGLSANRQRWFVVPAVAAETRLSAHKGSQRRKYVSQACRTRSFVEHSSFWPAMLWVAHSRIFLQGRRPIFALAADTRAEPPQQALAFVTDRQPWAAHRAVQSNDCPNTVLNIVSTSIAAIGDRR